MKFFLKTFAVILFWTITGSYLYTLNYLFENNHFISKNFNNFGNDNQIIKNVDAQDIEQSLLRIEKSYLRKSCDLQRQIIHYKINNYQIFNNNDLFQLLNAEMNVDFEKAFAIGLDENNFVQEVKQVGRGNSFSVNYCIADALDIKGTKLIFIHNHPESKEKNYQSSKFFSETDYQSSQEMLETLENYKKENLIDENINIVNIAVWNKRGIGAPKQSYQTPLTKEKLFIWYFLNKIFFF